MSKLQKHEVLTDVTAVAGRSEHTLTKKSVAAVEMTLKPRRPAMNALFTKADMQTEVLSQSSVVDIIRSLFMACLRTLQRWPRYEVIFEVSGKQELREANRCAFSTPDL